MRNAHAAEPDVIAGGESVDVEALAGPDVSRGVEQPRFGGAEVFHGRHLHVRRIAVEDMGIVSRPGGDRRVVGEAVDAVGGGAPMRVADQLVAERLRRLRRAQVRAIEGGDDSALGVDLFDRVAERRAGRRGAEALRRRNRAIDQGGGGKDARGVVDEDEVGRGVDQGL